MKKEFEGKKLLIIGAIEALCPLVLAAQKMGVYVVVVDYNEDAPAKRIADEAVLIDALDVNALVQYCKENQIDGVTTGFVDILLPVYSEVCKRLNMPCYLTEKMITMSTNKVDFKNTCLKYGLNVPQTYVKAHEITESDYKRISYPVFVKPLDASGSRGADVCYNRQELESQFEKAKEWSPSKTVIIEDYLDGQEFLLNYVAVNGNFRLISMFDRYKSPDRSSAMNFSNLSIAPSKYIDLYYTNVNDKVIKMFKSLGFTDGIIFLQGFCNDSKVTFYEMGCRLGGAYPQLEEACLGQNPFDMIVRYALTGKMLYDVSQIGQYAAKYDKYVVSNNYLIGVQEADITEIRGVDTIRNLPEFIDLEQYKEIGTHFTRGRIIDHPIISFYMQGKSIEKIRELLSYTNEVFDTVDENGNSILSQKLDPQEII